MSEFDTRMDFVGTYEGRNDGRRARLEISDTPGDMIPQEFVIELEDLDRGTNYRTVYQPELNGPEHIFRDFELEEVDGDGSKHFKRLLVHTWDTSFISGATEWNGTEYGVLFEQVE